MQNVTLVGIDLGKHSFHVQGQDRTSIVELTFTKHS
jgi:hypothetical protein